MKDVLPDLLGPIIKTFAGLINQFLTDKPFILLVK